MRAPAHPLGNAYQALIVAGLWIVLCLLGGELTEGVAMSTLAAIFGPGVLYSGVETLAARRGSSGGGGEGKDD